MKSIGWTGQAFTGAVVITIAWLLGAFDVAPPLTFGEADVIPDSTVPGGKVTTYYKVEVTRDCALDVSRSTTDAAKIIWYVSSIHIPSIAIGPGSINLAMVIPSDAAAGTASFTNTYRYSCNVWQSLFSPWLPMPALSVDVDRG